MLSHNDVQYIVGLLFVAAEPNSIDANVGERILDHTTGTKRDVDVTLRFTDLVGKKCCLKGIEVKDEARPLDVQTVEELCLKLNDMPEVDIKGIVSASGYTAPAKKKAQFHGVQLFHFEEWDREKFEFDHVVFDSSFDSAQRTWTWSDSPSVLFLTDPEWNNTEPPLADDAIVVNADGSNPRVRKLAEHTLNRVANEVSDKVYEHQLGIPVYISKQVTFTDEAYIVNESKRYRLLGASVTGTIVYNDVELPPTFKALRREGESSPFSGAVVFEMQSGHLIGFTLSNARRDLRCRVIFPEERAAKIHNRKL